MTQEPRHAGGGWPGQFAAGAAGLELLSPSHAAQGPAMALQMQPLWFWQRLCTDQEKQPFSGSMEAEGVKTEAGRSGVRKEPMSLAFPQISHRIIA